MAPNSRGNRPPDLSFNHHNHLHEDIRNPFAQSPASASSTPNSASFGHGHGLGLQLPPSTSRTTRRTPTMPAYTHKFVLKPAAFPTLDRPLPRKIWDGTAATAAQPKKKRRIDMTATDLYNELIGTDLSWLDADDTIEELGITNFGRIDGPKAVFCLCCGVVSETSVCESCEEKDRELRKEMAKKPPPTNECMRCGFKGKYRLCDECFQVDLDADQLLSDAETELEMAEDMEPMAVQGYINGAYQPSVSRPGVKHEVFMGYQRPINEGSRRHPVETSGGPPSFPNPTHHQPLINQSLNNGPSQSTSSLPALNRALSPLDPSPINGGPQNHQWPVEEDDGVPSWDQIEKQHQALIDLGVNLEQFEDILKEPERKNRGPPRDQRRSNEASIRQPIQNNIGQGLINRSKLPSVSQRIIKRDRSLSNLSDSDSDSDLGSEAYAYRSPDDVESEAENVEPPTPVSPKPRPAIHYIDSDDEPLVVRRNPAANPAIEFLESAEDSDISSIQSKATPRITFKKRSNKRVLISDGEEYTADCVCTRRGGFNISCEVCESWQHFECYYAGDIEEAESDDFRHRCVGCEPRELEVNAKGAEIGSAVVKRKVGRPRGRPFGARKKRVRRLSEIGDDESLLGGPRVVKSVVKSVEKVEVPNNNMQHQELDQQPNNMPDNRKQHREGDMVWTSDCICGREHQLDVRCEGCESWQHLKCYYDDGMMRIRSKHFKHKCLVCQPRILDSKKSRKLEYRRDEEAFIQLHHIAERGPEAGRYDAQGRFVEPENFEEEFESESEDEDNEAGPWAKLKFPVINDFPGEGFRGFNLISNESGYVCPSRQSASSYVTDRARFRQWSGTSERHPTIHPSHLRQLPSPQEFAARHQRQVQVPAFPNHNHFRIPAMPGAANRLPQTTNQVRVVDDPSRIHPVVRPPGQPFRPGRMWMSSPREAYKDGSAQKDFEERVMTPRATHIASPRPVLRVDEFGRASIGVARGSPMVSPRPVLKVDEFGRASIEIVESQNGGVSTPRVVVTAPSEALPAPSDAASATKKAATPSVQILPPPNKGPSNPQTPIMPAGPLAALLDPSATTSRPPKRPIASTSGLMGGSHMDDYYPHLKKRARIDDDTSSIQDEMASTTVSKQDDTASTAASRPDEMASTTVSKPDMMASTAASKQDKMASTAASKQDKMASATVSKPFQKPSNTGSKGITTPSTKPPKLKPNAINRPAKNDQLAIDNQLDINDFVPETEDLGSGSNTPETEARLAANPDNWPEDIYSSSRPDEVESEEGDDGEGEEKPKRKVKAKKTPRGSGRRAVRGGSGRRRRV